MTSAREAAQEILDRHWNGDFPVNPARIARAMDLGVRPGEPERPHVTPMDKRYALALDLGCLLAPRYGVCGEQATGRWAQDFALELLIPRSTILALWAHGYGMFRLAGAFRVSLVLVNERLCRLGLR